MSAYPEELPVFRELENAPGVVFDEHDLIRPYAEDWLQVFGEIIAVMTELDRVKDETAFSEKAFLETLGHSYLHYYNDFLGDYLPPEFYKRASGGNVVPIAGVGGILEATCGPNALNNTGVFLGGDNSGPIKAAPFTAGKKASFEFFLNQVNTGSANVHLIVGFGGVDNNFINTANRIVFRRGVDHTDWIVETKAGGTATATRLTGVSSFGWQKLKIATTSDSVKFYINDMENEVAEHTTNIPSVPMCWGVWGLIASGNLYWLMDYLKIWQERN